MDVWKEIFKGVVIKFVDPTNVIRFVIGLWKLDMTLLPEWLCESRDKEKTEIRCYTVGKARSLLLKKEMFCFILVPSLDR